MHTEALTTSRMRVSEYSSMRALEVLPRLSQTPPEHTISVMDDLSLSIDSSEDDILQLAHYEHLDVKLRKNSNELCVLN